MPYENDSMSGSRLLQIATLYRPGVQSSKRTLQVPPLLTYIHSGASIPMGQGGHVPPIFGPGGHDHECPPQYL